MTEVKSQAMHGLGTVFNRWNATGSAWEQIAEITSIGGPGKSKDTIEVTHLNSPDKYREYIGGLKDGGDLPLSMNYTEATYDKMNLDFEADEAQQYQIVLTDQKTFEFEGFVTELSLGIDTGDKISADCTIKITGKVEDS